MFSAGAEELFMLASTVSSSFNRKIKDVKQVKSLSRLPLLQRGFLLVLADNITSPQSGHFPWLPDCLRIDLNNLLISFWLCPRFTPPLTL